MLSSWPRPKQNVNKPVESFTSDFLVVRMSSTEKYKPTSSIRFLS